ncbi:hypothetical protein [Sphingomonas sp. ID0503]|uniref:hypothetical protein n=1 Tax=Sphingomonas sp. ID0503 TaxID=3399691 RepID=UPI003AFA0389
MKHESIEPRSGIQPSLDLSVEGVLRSLPVEQHRAMFENMTREEFEARLFSFLDIETLPVGHFLDHRVTMPAERAEWLIAQPPTAIAAYCRKMLCSVDHSHAADLVASALKLDMPAYASRARTLAENHRPFALFCLRGLLGDAEALIATFHADFQLLNEHLIDSAIIWGALEEQLVALRLKRIAEYHSEQVGGSGDTLGSVLTVTKAMTKALLYAERRLGEGPKAGRRPKLFADLKEEAEALHERFKSAYPHVSEDQLETLLASTLTILVDLFQISPDMFALDESEAASAARTRISTAWTGFSGGEQLAFASIRVISYMRKLRKRGRHGGLSQIARNWLADPLPPRSDRDVEMLLFVNRAAVWHPGGTENALDARGKEVDLRSLLKTYHEDARTAGEDLIKTVREEHRRLFSRPPIGADLIASQLFDILPDYRFRITTVLPPTPGSVVLGSTTHAQLPKQVTEYRIQKKGGGSGDRTSGRGSV